MSTVPTSWMLCLHDIRSSAFLQVGNTNLSSTSLDERSCSSPHGDIDHPADTVPSLYWGNRNRHQVLEKACHKLQGILDVQRTMKSVKHQRQMYYYPVRKNVLAPLQRNTMHNCRIELTLMSSKSTSECPNDADAWKRTTEWTLSGPWELEARPSFLTIALSHTSFHLSVDYVTVSLLVLRFTDLWEFMPAWLALCDLGAPGWGEPWFPHSAMLLFLTSLVWRFCDWCFAPFCHLFSRHTNPFDNAKPLSLATVLSGPMSLCNAFGVLVAVLFVLCFVLFCLLFWLFVGFFLVLLASWRPIGLCTGPISALLLRPIYSTRWMNFNALIDETCCMLIERVDRPGESQEATGGKKNDNTSLRTT